LFPLHSFLYHYTTAQTAAYKILTAMMLRMGSFQALNDPREAKTWPFRIYFRSPKSNLRFQSTLFDEISTYITSKSLILYCTRDDPTVTEQDDDRVLRSGCGHPRMWSQYADNHKGVCLVLDWKKLH